MPISKIPDATADDCPCSSLDATAASLDDATLLTLPTVRATWGKGRHQRSVMVTKVGDNHYVVVDLTWQAVHHLCRVNPTTYGAFAPTPHDGPFSSLSASTARRLGAIFDAADDAAALATQQTKLIKVLGTFAPPAGS